MIPSKQIRIEKWSAPKDTKGDAKEVVEVAYNIWATPVKDRGNRTDSFGQTKLNQGYRFNIRFRPDWQLSGTWKLIYMGRRFTITSIDRIDEKRFNWQITAEV